MPLTRAQVLGKYLASMLADHDRTFYEPPPEDLWGVGSLVIPSRGDLPFGLQSITSLSTEIVGRAAVTIGAYDIPMVKAEGGMSEGKVLGVVASAEWSFPELEAFKQAQASGVFGTDDIVELNTFAVNVGIDRRIHELIVYGFPEIGFEGLLTTTKIQEIDDSATEVMQMTPDALYDWFQAVVSQFKVMSKMPYSSIVAYVPDEMLKILARRFGAGSNESPYIALTATDRGTFLKDVRSITELDTANLLAMGLTAANKGMMFLGDFDNPRALLKRFVPKDKNGPFLKDTGFHYGLTGWSGTSEPLFKMPERFARIKIGTTPKP